MIEGIEILKSDDNIEVVNLIRIKKDDGLPYAKCSCGWESKPSDKTFLLGISAFNHRDATGHELRR